MDAASCLLCGGQTTVKFDAREFILRRKVYAHARCSACSHMFVHPPPNEAELEEFYAEAWPHLRETYPLAEGQSPEAVAETVNEIYKIELLRSLGILEQAGAVLDIGFGNGGFLLAMHRQGWRGVGLEFTEKVDLVFDPAGRFEVRFGAQALQQLEAESYDLITMWHVIEHLTDPVGVLELARRALRPGGRIVIAVPNAAGLNSRLFKSQWYAIMPPWHLQQFTPRSLALAFERAGLALEEVRGFDPLTQHILWVDSMTKIMENVPAAWYRGLVTTPLRVVRKVISLTTPALIRAETLLRLPGAIAAVARKP